MLRGGSLVDHDDVVRFAVDAVDSSDSARRGSDSDCQVWLLGGLNRSQFPWLDLCLFVILHLLA